MKTAMTSRPSPYFSLRILYSEKLYRPSMSTRFPSARRASIFGSDSRAKAPMPCVLPQFLAHGALVFLVDREAPALYLVDRQAAEIDLGESELFQALAGHALAGTAHAHDGDDFFRHRTGII